jgi:rfaE bifunctional protein nucleotidyltransferase chain/domain
MEQTKYVTLEQMSNLVKSYQEQGKQVVHCHGCFDLYHVGHLRHMKEAKQYGDILIVTVTPDRFVNKGEGRPAFNEELRVEMIAALEIVDHVAINKWPSAVETLKMLRPDYYVKGPDYRTPDKNTNPNIHKERKICEELGIKLVFTDGFTSSSTELLNKYFSIKSAT